MLISDIDYFLPENLIAQAPLSIRDQSRLLVLNKKSQTITHHKFCDLIDFLQPSDLLVFNNTKVLKARLFGKKKTGGAVEIFLLEPIDEKKWYCLLYPARRIKEGEIIKINDQLEIKIITKYIDNNKHQIEFLSDANTFDIINEFGNIPLPPYIKVQDHEYQKFEQRYQTVFAKSLGSVAAPTAGLHFTNELIQKLTAKKIDKEYITLHVGLGTFLPIKTTKIQDHKMHKEWYNVANSAAEKLSKAYQEKRRIIAVGTTVTRVLETIFHENSFTAGTGYTDIFIYPGYELKAISGLITNFHLPKSTLLLLVKAFAGGRLIENAYKIAIENKYRFYSFGDAMFIE
ncbi:MAG: tRNA preQ1(34) S-adenosylmethionine ribosyltransferase-isomerase QueA [Candidatus Margulisiibacteriota bacterium]|jgi:S-adenosylmethionine:tRNA ribosyltransferase-isomerase